MAQDERTYYKRTRIRTAGSFITPRIKHGELKVDRIKTLTALPPNATHSYDASNMDKSLSLVESIGLEALPIFDSLGGEVGHVALIKILFKIANIKNIENNYREPKFPYMSIEMEEGERRALYKKILESSFFIR
jgi:DNA-directed RNA polymerase